MPINVYWEDEQKRVIRCDFIGQWSWGDYDVMVDQTNAMMREVSHLVSVISDVTRSARMPGGNGIRHLRRMKANMPPNIHMIVTVGKFSSYASAILGAFIKVYTRGDSRMALAKSLDDAHAILQKQTAG